MDENIWNNLGQVDEDDNIYGSEIDLILTPNIDLNINPVGKIITKTVGARKTYHRDPKLAAYRFSLANYQCEIDSNHSTFTSAKTGMPFVEAHHFIPMKYQSLFEHPLDNAENIISLCPNCHRGFHHAITGEKMELITNIYAKRTALSNTHSLNEIAGFYNCTIF
ncbi:MAG: HNH endonuclease [Saprospiraceae bacterium]